MAELVKYAAVGCGGMGRRHLRGMARLCGSPRRNNRILSTAENFRSGAVGQWINDHAGHGLRQQGRHVYGSKGSLQCPGDRNGRPIKLHLDDGSVVEDERILEHAPSYALEPLAAELFGGERVWTYSFEFNDTDSRILALEYFELGECVLGRRKPEMTGEEGRADVALTYAPFEAGRLGRPVTLEEMVSGRAAVYQREIDEKLGLLQPARG